MTELNSYSFSSTTCAHFNIRYRPDTPRTMATPPAKRAKLSGNGAVVSWSSGLPSQNSTLTTELIARVATFEAVGPTLRNICLGVGRRDSNVVRHAYLRNNLGYLGHFLEKYVSQQADADHYQEGDGWKTCRDRYLAWMKVNSEWRKLVSDDKIDEAVSGVISKTDPLTPFYNPAIAIELRLMDSLKYLVETKGVDLNTCTWGSFDVSTCVWPRKMNSRKIHNSRKMPQTSRKINLEKDTSIQN